MNDMTMNHFQLIVIQRIADHKAAEAKREAEQREKIRAEEVARLEREQQERDRAEAARVAKETAAAPVAGVVAQSPSSQDGHGPEPVSAAATTETPTLKLRMLINVALYDMTETELRAVLNTVSQIKQSRRTMQAA